MSWPEIILHVWVLSLVLDIGKEILQQPSDAKDNKLMEWLHGYFWNKLDAVWVILFVIGGTCRLTSQFIHISNWLRLDDVHLIYTFSCILSYIRLYEFYMTMSHIGPKLIVLKRMIGDLIVFFLIVAICILCYGIGRVALLHRERQPFWIVFKEVFALPYWHLFGEIYLEDENRGRFPSCEANPLYCHESPHAWIVPIMLAIYMLIGNILLVNMLIAVFTHIFDEVNKNSREIYLFEIYVSGLQFSRRSVLIPPFLIIEDLLFGFYFICTKIYHKIYINCCCVTQECNEQCQLQKKLQRVYIDNLRLFEKEARSKYLKKIGIPEDPNTETIKIEQRISYLSDTVRKLHQIHESHRRKKSATKPRSSPYYSQTREASGYKQRSMQTVPGQDISTEAEDEDDHLEAPGDFIRRWSKIKKRTTEQQLALSYIETEQRLSQVEATLTGVVHKLENIDKNISHIAGNIQFHV